jgi:D-alanyl-D-alanine dipeptidase
MEHWFMSDANAAVYRQRLARVARAMGDAHVDALVLCPGADLLYFTGFEHGHAGERLLALVLRADGSSRWVVPAMNVPQVEAHALPGQAIRAWTDGEWFHTPLREVLAGAGTVAFDDEARAGFLLDVLALNPAPRVTRASSVTRGLRIRKEPAEIEALRAAGRTVDETIPEAIGFCRPGRTESDIDRELRAALVRRSPESAVAFTIIASGENSALPHHETADRVIQRGDVVVLDYGTRRAKYLSDITVTCSVGEPADAEVRKVYRVVWEAQQAALGAVRPGVACGDVDRAARSVIEAAGYGPYFTHRTGHGLGVQGHEPPYLVGGRTEKLEEGMVFSVEPGIYLPRRFGVRLEIIASVTSDGVRLLNAPSAPELPVACL